MPRILWSKGHGRVPLAYHSASTVASSRRAREMPHRSDPGSTGTPHCSLVYPPQAKTKYGTYCNSLGSPQPRFSPQLLVASQSISDNIIAIFILEHSLRCAWAGTWIRHFRSVRCFISLIRPTTSAPPSYSHKKLQRRSNLETGAHCQRAQRYRIQQLSTRATLKSSPFTSPGQVRLSLTHLQLSYAPWRQLFFSFSPFLSFLLCASSAIPRNPPRPRPFSSSSHTFRHPSRRAALL
jgi:hypothetical protein